MKWQKILINWPAWAVSELLNTAWKLFKYEVFSGRSFPIFGLNMEIYGVNIGKYGPEKAPYLDTFHAVQSVSYFLNKNKNLDAKQ